MQLESTLFGICVVQIRPLLEKLLKLPSDSLIKEISLTEKLQELLTKYQVPSDLLSYDGPYNTLVDSKVNRVKELVTKMEKVIEGSKLEQLEEARLKSQMRAANVDLPKPSPPPAPTPSYEPPPSLPEPEPDYISPRKKENFFTSLYKLASSPFKKKQHESVSTFGDGGPV